MLIIPVLDVKGGLVVRAHLGQRHRYRPIETPLSRTADVVDVAEGLRRIHPFPTFYIADLDAIENGVGTIQTANRLSGMQQAPDVWIDAGFRNADSLEQALAADRVSAVLGSETQTDTSLLRRFGDNSRLILSLDFQGDAFLGAPAILEEADLWPARVIVMTLGRVGGASGPDFERLEAIKRRAGARAVIAAGGVRGLDDLQRLKSMGLAAALVATALHNGEVTGEAVSGLLAANPG